MKNMLQTIVLASLITSMTGYNLYADACLDKCTAQRDDCISKAEKKHGGTPGAKFTGKMLFAHDGIIACDNKHIECVKACAEAAKSEEKK